MVFRNYFDNKNIFFFTFAKIHIQKKEGRKKKNGKIF